MTPPTTEGLSRTRGTRRGTQTEPRGRAELRRREKHVKKSRLAFVEQTTKHEGFYTEKKLQRARVKSLAE